MTDPPKQQSVACVWKDASVWPSPEIELLLFVDEKVIVGYWDYGVYKNAQHETVHPERYAILQKPQG